MTLPNDNEFDSIQQKQVCVTLSTPKNSNGQRTKVNTSLADISDQPRLPAALNQMGNGHVWPRQEQQHQENACQPLYLITNKGIQPLQQVHSNQSPNQNSSRIEQKNSNQNQQISNGTEFRVRNKQGCSVAWAGYLEWMEKIKSESSDGKWIGNRTRELTCQISVKSEDDGLRKKIASWPSKLWIRPIPKALFQDENRRILSHLRGAKRIEIKPSDCKALQSLLEITTDQYVGSIHLETSDTKDEIRTLILVYCPEKRAYDGVIPKDQQAYIDSLKRAVSETKNRVMTRRNSAVNKDKVYPNNRTVQGQNSSR